MIYWNPGCTPRAHLNLDSLHLKCPAATHGGRWPYWVAAFLEFTMYWPRTPMNNGIILSLNIFICKTRTIPRLLLDLNLQSAEVDPRFMCVSLWPYRPISGLGCLYPALHSCTLHSLHLRRLAFWLVLKTLIIKGLWTCCSLFLECSSMDIYGAPSPHSLSSSLIYPILARPTTPIQYLRDPHLFFLLYFFLSLFIYFKR